MGADVELIKVLIRFYKELNDFLPRDRRNRWIAHELKGHPSVKDTIEAFRVPHPEVGCILINGLSKNFSEQLQEGDRIAVYPDAKLVKKSPLINLAPHPLKTPRFILDSHLGKLARHLRLLGFDTIYKKLFPDEEIIKIITKVKWILLTRDIGLLKNKAVRHGYWVRSVDSFEQIKEVSRRYQVGWNVKPFTLCLECNGKIRRVAKAKVAQNLPTKVRDHHHRFYRCARCLKVYWRGSHYERLSKLVRQIEN